MKKRMALVLAAGIFLAGAGHMLAAPGDEGDPIITLSYIEQVLIPSITEKISKTSAPVFEVVEVEAGKSVICEAGTELILRKGAASIIATQKGGLANVTQGVDLQNGAAVPANSLLIVPLSDGRGVSAQDDVILMVKGKYSIK